MPFPGGFGPAGSAECPLRSQPPGSPRGHLQSPERVQPPPRPGRLCPPAPSVCGPTHLPTPHTETAPGHPVPCRGRATKPFTSGAQGWKGGSGHRARLLRGPQVICAPAQVRPLAMPDTPPPSSLLPPYTSLNPTCGHDVQPVSQAFARAGPSPGLLLPLFIRPASVCTFYTFSSNAPSSMKPPLTAPQSSEAGAGTPSDFKSKHQVLIILGSLALDPGPKARSVVGLWERSAESDGISRDCKEAMMHAEVSSCLLIEGLTDTLGQVPEGPGLFRGQVTTY